MRTRDFNSLITMFVGGCLALTTVIMFACSPEQSAPVAPTFVPVAPQSSTDIGPGPVLKISECDGEFLYGDNISVDESNILTGTLHFSSGGTWSLIGGPSISLNGINDHEGWFGRNGKHDMAIRSFQLACGLSYTWHAELDNGCLETGDEFETHPCPCNDEEIVQWVYKETGARPEFREVRCEYEFFDPSGSYEPSTFIPGQGTVDACIFTTYPGSDDFTRGGFPPVTHFELVATQTECDLQQ